MNKPVCITWRKFIVDVEKLANSLKGKGFDKILVVTKGGLIPAYFISKILGINYIDTACVSFYEGTKRRELKVDKIEQNNEDGWLIIDDLIDSGLTMKIVKQHYPKAKMATLYIKEHSSVLPDYYVQTFPDVWINFPWGD